MTELETVLLCAFAFMVYLWVQQRAVIRGLRMIIFAVGEKKARIEINEESKVVNIVRL
jgi:hypothetical protein